MNKYSIIAVIITAIIAYHLYSINNLNTINAELSIKLLETSTKLDIKIKEIKDAGHINSDNMQIISDTLEDYNSNQEMDKKLIYSKSKEIKTLLFTIEKLKKLNKDFDNIFKENSKKIIIKTCELYILKGDSNDSNNISNIGN